VAALTFDDGYEDNFKIFRLLQTKGLPFTIFLCTGFLESGVCNWGTQFRGLHSLTWQQASEMAHAEVELGSHMHNHLRWTECSDAQLKEEIDRSTRLIGERCGRAVRFFAYPYGRCDARCGRILREHGIQAAFTGVHKTSGKIEDRFQIPRLSVNAEDSLIDLKQSITGQRDPLALAGSVRRLFTWDNRLTGH
jgi:peptidoglycan/xylan/chitin deacetylase (PgdA/CDA1 family)